MDVVQGVPQHVESGVEEGMTGDGERQKGATEEKAGINFFVVVEDKVLRRPEVAQDFMESVFPTRQGNKRGRHNVTDLAGKHNNLVFSCKTHIRD